MFTACLTCVFLPGNFLSGSSSCFVADVLWSGIESSRHVLKIYFRRNALLVTVTFRHVLSGVLKG